MEHLSRRRGQGHPPLHAQHLRVAPHGAHDARGPRAGPDLGQERLDDPIGLERSDGGMDEEPHDRIAGVGLLLDELIVGRAAAEAGRKRALQAVSFSRLDTPWRWVVQPRSSSGQPHARGRSVAWSPIETFSITTGAVRRSEVTHSEAEPSPGCTIAWRSWKTCMSSALTGARHAHASEPVSTVP
jgi:hypothetical protein